MFYTPMTDDIKDYDEYSKVFTDEDMAIGIVHCVRTNYRCDNCRIYGLCDKVGSLGMLWILATRLAAVEGIDTSNWRNPLKRSVTGKLFDPCLPIGKNSSMKNGNDE